MRAALFVPAALALLVLSGCGSAPSAGRPPSPSVSPPPGALLVQEAGSGVCLQSVTSVSDFGYWRGVLKATEGLRITAVRVASGHGITARGGIGTKVLGPVTGAGISNWPMSGPGKVLRREVDWATRTGLVGLHLGAGHSVLPIVHVRTEPDGQLDSLAFSYRTDAGHVGTAVMNASLRFSRETC